MSLSRWLNKLWYIRTVEYYSATQRDQLYRCRFRWLLKVSSLYMTFSKRQNINGEEQYVAVSRSTLSILLHWSVFVYLLLDYEFLRGNSHITSPLKLHHFACSKHSLNGCSMEEWWLPNSHMETQVSRFRNRAQVMAIPTRTPPAISTQK